MPIEHEVKLGVWPGFTLPDLSGIAEGVHTERLPDQRLEATYHDTADLRLARWNITLRYRTGEDEDVWTLKLPGGSVAGALVRDEVVVPGDPKAVPDAVLDHIRAYVRTAELQPVARLHTLRWRAVLRDADGKVVVEVVDDEVSMLESRRVALRFREVEVELGERGDVRVLDEVVARLRAAGAGAPDRTAKVVRALGPRALETPELVVEKVGRDATAAEVIRAGLTNAVLRVLEHDAAIRLTDDAEAVHQARVGTRRLRSDLRTFAPLLSRAWSEPLRDHLSWLAGRLGGVRDTDVLIERLEADVARLDPGDQSAAAPIVERLRAQRDDARVALLDAMQSARYLALLDALVDGARDPVVLPEASAPARDLLPRLANGPWEALAKSVRRAGAALPDEVLHGIRIKAKRARYAADVAAHVAGKPAQRFSSAVADVQEVLGAHQDARVRMAWLRDNAGDVEPRTAFAAGQLVAMARADAEQWRAAWPDAWKHASRPRLRSWLTP